MKILPWQPLCLYTRPARMVILDVFTRSAKIKYKARLLSKTTLLITFCKLCTILIPLVFAYYSKGFWLKRDKFYEQPEIRFRGEFILVAVDQTTVGHKPIFCSSFPGIRDRLEFIDNCTIFKIREIDQDFDGVVDKMNLTVQINLPRTFTLNSLVLVVPIDYRLKKVCSLKMRSAIIYETFLPNSARDLLVMGNLRTTQTGPISCQKHSYNYYDYSIFGDEKSLEFYSIRKILENYSSRNLSTKLEDVYFNSKNTNSRQFTLNLMVTYPENMIYYKPTFWHVVKMAWIQYLAIYFVISNSVTRILCYIFENRLVLFYEDNPCKTK